MRASLFQKPVPDSSPGSSRDADASKSRSDASGAPLATQPLLRSECSSQARDQTLSEPQQGAHCARGRVRALVGRASPCPAPHCVCVPMESHCGTEPRVTAPHAMLHAPRARSLSHALCSADNTWAFSSLARHLSSQWKEAVNTSFFGTASIDGEGATPVPMHGFGPDHAAAVHPPYHSNTNPTIHQGPFMEDSLRALRRGLLAQLDLKHAVQRSSPDDKATPPHDGGSIGGGSNFSLMLDMGYELSEDPGVEAGASDEEGSSRAASAAAAASGTSRPVQFVSHDPLVFACLRHSLNIPDNEYREAFLLSVPGFEEIKPATSKSGRSFYITKDHRFILKSLSRAEADFLLEVLCQYFEHVAKHPSTLLPRFCAQILKSECILILALQNKDTRVLTFENL